MTNLRTISRALYIMACIAVAGITAGTVYEEVKFDEGSMKKGPRSVENVKTNITKILPRVFYLYAEALGPDSSLSGTVTIRMEVDRKGKPGFVDVHQTTMHNEELQDLILAALVESVFDKWAKGREKTEIIFPIVLTPDKASSAPKSRARRVFEEQQSRKVVSDSLQQKSDSIKREEEKKEEEEWIRYEKE